MAPVTYAWIVGTHDLPTDQPYTDLASSEVIVKTFGGWSRFDSEESFLKKFEWV